MLIGSLRVSGAVFMVFFTLQLTEIALVIGFFKVSSGGSEWWLHFGGWLGILTAAVAWYASAAGVMNGVAGRVVFPVGKPFVSSTSAV
jgi:hypothetical protein